MEDILDEGELSSSFLIGFTFEHISCKPDMRFMIIYFCFSLSSSILIGVLFCRSFRNFFMGLPGYNIEPTLLVLG